MSPSSKTSIFDGFYLPPIFDAHVHLRDGMLMETVVPTLKEGGVSQCYVMPNLLPPLTTPAAATSYITTLQRLFPSTVFISTLYLHPDLTPDLISAASDAGIRGVKAYPAGVTTNSAAGVLDWEVFYPVFKRMEEVGMVLNLHGEVPFSPAPPSDSLEHFEAVSVLNAEPLFLPTLHTLHKSFPRLKIVLEHVTTRAALSAVAACGANVAATITAHHLSLVTDDVVGDPFCFCKPVAKSEADRRALIRAVVGLEGEGLKGRIFFGSDSAPHALDKKVVRRPGEKAPAGCFTQPYATQLVFGAVEKALEDGVLQQSLSRTAMEEELRGFMGRYGRRFYDLPEEPETETKIVLRRKGERVRDFVDSPDGTVRVPCFGAGMEVLSLDWEGES